MRNRPRFFMGYEMIYDPEKMEYIIHDGHGNSVRAGEFELENDSEYMKSVVDVINTWQAPPPGFMTAAQAVRNKPDLRDVSTRDLLNEAFRRGAIKQMNVKRMVASEMVRDPDYVKHLQKSIRQDALAGAVDELEQYGVFNVGKKESALHNPWEDVEYSVDYFICKHPLTLKKEEGSAY